MKSVKLLAIVAVLAVMLASVTAAQAKGRWTGIDPEVEVNGHTLNVWVGWQSPYSCTIEDVRIRFLVPDDSDATLISESSDVLPCADGGSIMLMTQSEIIERFERNVVTVKTEVEASENFAVRVKVFKDGRLATQCGGVSNQVVSCEKIKLDGKRR